MTKLNDIDLEGNTHAYKDNLKPPLVSQLFWQGRLTPILFEITAFQCTLPTALSLLPCYPIKNCKLLIVICLPGSFIHLTNRSANEETCFKINSTNCHGWWNPNRRVKNQLLARNTLNTSFINRLKEARKGFFVCYSVCETMKGTKEGYFIV